MRIEKKIYLCTTLKQGNIVNEVADSVAQLVEQYTFNVWVLGSNPSRVTKIEVHYNFIRICLCGEIGRHAILRGWFPKDVLVRVQSQVHR